MNDHLTHFLTALSTYKGENVFNPWRDTDTDYEVGRAVSIRQEQLMDYLTRRIGRAKILLIAEACGYQGGHFSGIAMTCERMLLNQHPKVTSRMILCREGTRTSRMDSPFITKAAQKEKGFNEPTDSVVWSACLEAGLAPDEFLLWNIFPFHPYKKGNLLTNRTPTDEELAIGLTYTKERGDTHRSRLLRHRPAPSRKRRREHLPYPAEGSHEKVSFCTKPALLCRAGF